MLTELLTIGGAALGLIALYGWITRPWFLRWGATQSELQKPMAGDDLVENPAHHDTHAISIGAQPEAVWPWIVQIGQNRGGFYSYTWVENLVGCDIRNANRILPEHQQLAPGDGIRLHPRFPHVPVAIVRPPHALVLGSRNGGTWAFSLEPLAGRRTRLLIRSRWPRRSTALARLGTFLLLEPLHFVMERKMLLGIKARAELAALRPVPHPRRRAS
jgi:hypothetical protein